MRTIVLSLVLLVAGCESQAVSGTTTECDNVLGTGWGQGYGVEVQSSSNLDSDRCAQFGNVWCCAL